MILLDKIKKYFDGHIQIHAQIVETFGSIMVQASEVIVQALLHGHKILACGGGYSAIQAHYFCAKMLNHSLQDKISLPAISLINDMSMLTSSVGIRHYYKEVYAQQIRGLGQSGDILLAVSASSYSANILAAIETAHERAMRVVVIADETNEINHSLQEDDILICVPNNNNLYINETHLTILHCLYNLINFQLFGQEGDSK